MSVVLCLLKKIWKCDKLFVRCSKCLNMEIWQGSFVISICFTNLQLTKQFLILNLQQTNYSREIWIWNKCYLQPDMKFHFDSKSFKTSSRETEIFQEKVNISHCKFEIDELRAQTLESPSPPPLAKHTASPAVQLSVFWWMWSVFWWMGSLLFHKYLICQSWSSSDNMAFHRSPAKCSYSDYQPPLPPLPLTNSAVHRQTSPSLLRDSVVTQVRSWILIPTIINKVELQFH